MFDCDTHPRVLLVEGANDMHVVIHLSKHKGLPHNFCIVETGSVDELLNAIEVVPDVEERKAVGIVLDADEHPGTRWKEVT